MAVTWDSPLVYAVAGELDRALRDDRLRAFHLDREARVAVLFFRDHTLAARLHPQEGQLVLSGAEEPFPTARELAADVHGVAAPPDDRIILIHLRRPRGKREPVLVAVELMTNQWNLIVARGAEHRIRHRLSAGTSKGRLQTGQTYRPPPASDRAGAGGELSESEWAALLPDGPAPERRRRLLATVAWSSSLNSDALLGLQKSAAEPASPSPVAGGFELWRRLSQPVVGETPVLLHLERGLQPYPVPLPGVKSEPVSSLLEGLTRTGGPSTQATLLPARWESVLEGRAHFTETRLRSLERELDRSQNAVSLRASGDLILARLHEIPRGSSRVSLSGFDGSQVELELDPSRTPAENAADYYDRAGRAKRAANRLPALIEAAKDEVRRARGLLESARRGEVDHDELRRYLADESLEPDRAGVSPSLPYRRYRSSGGIEIRVGRGDRRNDDLTFQHSRPDDIWLHARHASGAHVILRWSQEGNPPGRDLSEAAVLAALHSRARGSGTVPVDWTRRKYVRKPRRARPGTVALDRIQTVFVEPDPELEVRLRER